ncbi:MAG: hypothetical protein GX585_04960, partial [Clostridiales bacterium]|nr:hypothetical protein [Clostridiales bacterium]
RVLSASELARQGCLPPVGGEIKLTFSFGPDALPKGWSREGSLARLFPKDPLLARTAEQVGAALIRRGKRRFQLAVPWDVRAPFPLHPLFCLAKTETLNGADYLVFSFDAAGTPLSPD